MNTHGLLAVPIGDKSPEVVNAVVEISRGSHNKYEFDEKLGVLRLDRVLYSPVHYPLDYGFIPETRSEDGDHLDVLILGSDPLVPGSVLEVRPVAIMNMIDSGEPDAKILAAQVANPRFKSIKEVSDVEAYNDHLLKEVAHFFAVMKDLQGKKVEVLGWEGADKAREEIKKAQEAYSKEDHNQ
jgi:inorganic pyrophosphatase